MNIFKWVAFCLFAAIFTSCEKDPVIVDEPGQVLYSFYVAGHTYGKPGVNNIGFHPPFKDKFDWLNELEFLDFGILTGDIVLSGTEQNWNEIDEDLKLLEDQVYFAAGNHDMTDRPLYESRYGKSYQSFVHNKDLFVLLDPNIDEWNISGVQLDFLKNTLNDNANDVDNIYVFFHQLLWWSPDNIYQNVCFNSLAGRADMINFWDEVEPLFNALPNPTYMFAGDVGAFNDGCEFMYHSYDNITFVASGMGGEVRDNIIIAEVHEDKSTSLKLIAINGNDLDALGKLEDYELP